MSVYPNYTPVHWPTVEAFGAHLAAHDPLEWERPNGYRYQDARGWVLHHTFVPTLNDGRDTDWRGMASMNGIVNYYVNTLGWDRYPHLFVAVGSRNPAHDGIYQMMPLNKWGIHAQAANAFMRGIEVVGNYDRAFWSEQMQSFMVDLLATCLRWTSVRSSQIVEGGERYGGGNGFLDGHRNYTTEKSCPGNAVSLYKVRQSVAKRLAGVPIDPNAPHKGVYRVKLNDLWVRQTPHLMRDNQAYHELPDGGKHFYSFDAGAALVIDAIERGDLVTRNGVSSPFWGHLDSHIGWVSLHPAILAYVPEVNPYA